MKNTTETRALLDALCAWLVEDAKFMPDYVERLRDRFEAEIPPEFSKGDRSERKANPR